MLCLRSTFILLSYGSRALWLGCLLRRTVRFCRKFWTYLRRSLWLLVLGIAVLHDIVMNEFDANLFHRQIFENPDQWITGIIGKQTARTYRASFSYVSLSVMYVYMCMCVIAVKQGVNCF